MVTLWLGCWVTQDEASPDDTGSFGLAFTSFDIRASYGCGVRQDGTLACWGADTWGETVPPEGPFLQVSTGADHACGITGLRTLECWGRVEGSRLDAPTGIYVDVSAGETASCAIREEGDLECWGADAPYATLSVLSPPTGTFVDVSVGEAEACAARENGGLVCWADSLGWDDAPPVQAQAVSIGDRAACALSSTGAMDCWASWSGADIYDPPGYFAQVDVADDNLWCGAGTDGVGTCWGLFDEDFGTGVEEVQAAGYTSCARYASGRVDCTGGNLGDPDDSVTFSDSGYD